MLSIKELTCDQAAGVRYLLADIDDTMTKEGKLLPEAFAALWRCHEAGVAVIPVTGRPAGWCDLIARQWPVEAVIGENGAFAFYETNGTLKQMFHPDVASEAIRKKLALLREEVLRTVPESRVAKDQFSRLFDVAIDFAEEEPKLPLQTAASIKKVCEQRGAKAKISSIHVNAWFGDYDKLSTALLYLEKREKIFPKQAKKVVLYCGDSPNDVPMFRFFPLSCGVGNLARFREYLECEPAFITEGWYGLGFAELVDHLLSSRKKK